MDVRALGLSFLAWVLYPLWLAAGAADYLCHRRAHIEQTSGAVESWLHVAQFISIAALLALATLFAISTIVWFSLLGIALVHTALSFIDVVYSEKRRRISPAEQLIHGFLDVIPLIAVGLLAVLNWPLRSHPTTDPWFQSAPRFLIVSFCVLAGTPILEELVRTLHARRRAPHGGLIQRGARAHPPSREYAP
jgi:hypothetical protein